MRRAFFAAFLLAVPVWAHAAFISTSVAVYGEPGEQVLDFPASSTTASTATAAIGGSAGLATGSFATGNFSAYAQAQSPFTFVEETTCEGVCDLIPTDGGIASAVVNFSEVLHVQGILAAPQTVTLVATVEGTLTSGTPAFETQNAGGAGPLSAWLSWTGGNFDLSSGTYVNHNWVSHSDPAYCLSDEVCHFGTSGAFGGTFAVEALVDDLHRDVSFFGQLGAYSLWGGIADVSSLSIRVLLPDGLSFTSDSGVFPRDQPTSVPEPSVPLLFATALVFLAVKRRWATLACFRLRAAL